jgi:hypothetical protein
LIGVNDNRRRSSYGIARRGKVQKGWASMSRLPFAVVIAGAAFFVGHQLARNGPQRNGFAAMRQKMMKRMMDAMPDDSPPKLVLSILPRLQEQNDQILVMLKEQNELLRRKSTKRR